MVALTKDARARWEKERERREFNELEQYAAMNLALRDSFPTKRR